MPKKRENIEQKIIEKFKEAVKNLGYKIKVFTGQGKNNQIPICDKTYFQFGDLRVETNLCHVVIEVESAGGVTNLVKYWYCLKGLNPQPDIIENKPLVLLHIFRQNSEGDYESHLSLWKFLWGKMKEPLNNKMVAAYYTYKNSEDINELVNNVFNPILECNNINDIQSIIKQSIINKLSG